MKKLKLKAAVSSLLFTAILMNSAWSAQEEKLGTGFAWKDGAEIYAKICAYCHEANVGPQIRNRELPAIYIRTIVRNGSRAMPAFRSSEIDDESLAKVADFISQKASQY
ncbi:MAG TPA: cytochrome c [Nitrosomonas europaea]|uniref:c-type cytochrome n=1 Tax=Nitrosomonas europaea TaxID=915 RepID=UPI0024937F70|nr:cytochrome c [Nitrosomonas europaea]HRO55419.1 cytochrome c [Nitrosomonas europaea]HUM73066.1 cytochrome c [Nitrosomonas europaea]